MHEEVATALELAERAPAGADGLLFLPFLAGERSPLWDSDARGAFLGLTFAHGPSHLARALVESSGMSLRLLAEAVVAGGAPISELRVCGRQAQNRLWNQVKADVTGYEAHVPRVTEVALMGAAISAAVGAGFQPNLLAGGAEMVRIGETFTPTASHRARYDVMFETYKAAHAALAPLTANLVRAAAL
jgi:xylulokinase